MKSGIVFACFLLLFVAWLPSQSIGTFESVRPAASTENLVLPSGHRFQLIIQAWDSLPSGELMPVQADFTGYVPIQGSSTHGRLSINSEHIPGGVTVLEVAYDTLTELWSVLDGGRVHMTELEDSALPATARNCSGGISPWGTVVTCEEQEASTDLNGDGYEDFGWSLEIDPVTRTCVDHDGDSLPDKLWALGKFRHENAAFAPDSITVYQGEDNIAHGFLFKFIADQKGKLGSGRLYVLQQVGNNGTWIQVPNTTQSERNRTVALADSVGGTLFYRIEDVEVGPEGKIYFSSTALGKVFRFRDQGMTVTHFETFVNNQVFDIAHRDGTTPVMFAMPDNLAFDAEGNLWVLQDGWGNHIWVVGPDHTLTDPHIRIFANSPLGSEPTGITFSPDGRFLFMSFQHPSGNNIVPNPDASGRDVVFNRDATIVIARAENLGTPPTPVGTPVNPVEIVSLYPNPTSGLLNVSLEAVAAFPAEWSVVDMLGRTLLAGRSQLQQGENRLMIQMEALPAGQYLLRIKVANSELWRRCSRQ